MESSDPLSIFMKPPANETPDQMAERMEEERWQRRRNAEIEEMLRVERSNQKQNQVRVLLVGQSESGKSTILKNFQLAYAPRAFREERTTWTRIIYLNICRAINAICATVSTELELDNSPRAGPSASTSSADDDSSNGDDAHRHLIFRLKPLIDLEIKLQNQLVGPDDSEFFKGAPLNSTQEFFVRSGTSWRKTWTTRRSRDTQDSERSGYQEDESRSVNINQNVIQQLVESLPDMDRLWKSRTVQRIITRRKTKLEDSAPYFLDNLERIVTRNYEPSDEDVVRARLRTVGVQTYPIHHERLAIGGTTMPNEWVLYDVGGSRSQRAAWVPFFEHMNAIIFLAPINCFNEKLMEDHRVNRLEDSFNLYRTVVSSPLLKDVQVILFLNKTDLLAKNLQNGVEVKKHVTSFGDRPNEYDVVSTYFRKKFKDICHQFSPRPRPFYSYLTSAVDIAATAVTLSLVRDGILRTNLEHADML